MRDDFCVLILTHGRPDKVDTVETLKKHGYTGKVYIVIDDEDASAAGYHARYGEQVLVFPKLETAKASDEGDNFNDRRTILHARNAAFGLAKKVGCRYFIQLDDDYTTFLYRFDGAAKYTSQRVTSLDWLFDKLCTFLSETPFASVAISQGGDHIGGGGKALGDGEFQGGQTEIKGLRKAMNSFVCDTERPFKFVGRMNEDVNTYTCEQRKGLLFLTFMVPMLVQRPTQSNPGGMSKMYKDYGTYAKSFYSVMYAPSGVKIAILWDANAEDYRTSKRIHHNVHWNAVAPCIIHEKHKKAA